MRFIVTGGCGFVGQAICREITEHLPDAHVVAFDNLRRVGAVLNRLLTVEKKMHGRWAGRPISHACHTAENEKTRKRAG